MLPAAVFRQTLKQAADAAVRKAEQTGTAADKLAAATAWAAYAEAASDTGLISGQQLSTVRQQLDAVLVAARSAQVEDQFGSLITTMMALTNDVNTPPAQLNTQLNLLAGLTRASSSTIGPVIPSGRITVPRRESSNSDTSSYAAKAAGLVADKTVVNSDPVAAVDPVRAAIVATQATYVVNLPSVATNSAAASSVAATDSDVTVVGNLPVVKNAPANANFMADIARAKTIGQANQNVAGTQVTTPLIGDNTQGVKVDVIVVSAAG